MILSTVRSGGTENISINLVQMGLERRSLTNPDESTAVRLEDGTLAVKYQGRQANRRQFSGEFPAPESGLYAAALADWRQLIRRAIPASPGVPAQPLYGCRGERLALYDTVPRGSPANTILGPRLAHGYALNFRLDEPDLIDGHPDGGNRWQFEFVEDA